VAVSPRQHRLSDEPNASTTLRRSPDEPLGCLTRHEEWKSEADAAQVWRPRLSPNLIVGWWNGRGQAEDLVVFERSEWQSEEAAKWILKSQHPELTHQ